jgi:hypothetical protein
MSPVPGSARIEHVAQAVAERVVSLVMEAIDMDALINRIDVDAVVNRVDIDRLIDRVDVEKIVDRIDVKKIVERIDIDAVMEQTELGSIIARSTTGVASDVLDLVRAQAVGLDDFVARWVNRILRRRAEDLPTGPPALVGRAGPAPVPSAPTGDR